MNKPFLLKVVFACLSLLSFHAGAADTRDGKALYDEECAVCHDKGAPRIGDVNAWASLFKGGLDRLYANTIKGKGKMDARGGNEDLTDAQIKAAVDYMVVQSGGAALVKSSGAPAAAAAPAPAPAKTAPAAAPPAPFAGSAMTGANSFNRLMRVPSFNLPPSQDGVHDPAVQGTAALQAPAEAFAALPKSTMGNRVDWSKALNDKQINPRSDRRDPNAKLKAMDSQIVRQVKGTMPDVMFPHKTHTQWLACGSCHPAIFAPEVNASANQMSMAAIMLGQKCGVCHGTVAFPVSECTRCHSRSKPGQAKR
jgi:c(7)-type cytochrome triheme protein